MNAKVISAALSDRLWEFRHRKSLRWARDMRADAEAHRQLQQHAADLRWHQGRRVRFYLHSARRGS